MEKVLRTFRKEIGMKALARTVPVLVMCLVLLFIISLPRLESSPGSGPGDIKILMFFGDNVGGFHYLTTDIWEQCGWRLTSAGMQPTLSPCNVGVPFNVDTLITEITDVTEYDCLAIMQSFSRDGDSHDDILASPEAIALVQQAVAESLLVIACCGGVRVLAAADVIDGVTVTGFSGYYNEYISAGAIWAGPDVPPVLDGNILTCNTGHYYCHQIPEVMRRYFEDKLVPGPAN
jgi:transcriptional regulator GlxA family with amidase domain